MSQLNILPGMQEWAHRVGADQPAVKNKVSGYAATPGFGPAGETCGSCKHACKNSSGSKYWKCGIIRFRWSRGPGTDIRLKSPACRLWEAKEDR